MPNGEDKNFVRLCAAIEGFRVRYNAWPSSIRVFATIIEDLRDHVLGPVAFSRVEAKLRFVAADVHMIAEDAEGRSYNYAEEGFPVPRPDITAVDWLQVHPGMHELESAATPSFLPFEGTNYQNPKIFPGRLLVLGESHYLAEADKRPNFTQTLLADVMADRQMSRRNWRTPYYRNLFYILTGKRGSDVDQAEWERVWQSLAFYNFLQTKRLDRPLVRPNLDEWNDAKAPFRWVLEKLRPQFVLITGKRLSGHALSMPGIVRKEGVVGVWIPIDSGQYAFARCINHPSSIRSRIASEKAAAIVQGLLDSRWLSDNPRVGASE